MTRIKCEIENGGFSVQQTINYYVTDFHDLIFDSGFSTFLAAKLEQLHEII